ncbi:hypothetical protein [Marilutibacter maris]|uniref:hypothetical protein n=1 Tax=Marilutibacter maris TaxID=1605891 RepID=UPI000DA97F58|nr:hypothetical protein [Lysobacter maris]
MDRIETWRGRGMAMAAMALLASMLAGWSAPARADCPDGDPCETVHVYRLQSRLPIDEDAQGRPFQSLQEANATDAVAFRSILAVAAQANAYAIRYQVTRIASAPNDYCECNLEYDNRGCPSSLPREELQQCARVCRYNDGACQVTGFNRKHDGGLWYAFPAATQCGGPRNTWRKRTFGRTNPAWCDWREDARTVKDAACMARALGERPEATLGELFDDEDLCLP